MKLCDQRNLYDKSDKTKNDKTITIPISNSDFLKLKSAESLLAKKKSLPLKTTWKLLSTTESAENSHNRKNAI